ncbi:protein-methionine-sulfoxide reductase catalytic subunit MsrP [soil metagenome]
MAERAAPEMKDEITPQALYEGRRAFLRRAGVLAATVAATGAVYRVLNHVDNTKVETAELEGLAAVPEMTAAERAAAGFTVDEPKNTLEQISHYNNFYEFTTDKDGVASAAADFKTTGWKVEVGGLVGKPTTFDIDDLRKIAPPEERVYRMRCVEAWSMVIPWAGFSLSKLLERVEPRSRAKFVAFETLLDPERMPGQKTDVLQWPYVEGLRMAEAMHPLAILATGIYGRELPPQDGAPVRLVTPWKYGFKGIKSIVKITLTAEQPPTSWNRYGPREYGFLANVNPMVDHPRWSQATEQRIGESGRRKTLMFNGYGEQVASLYAGEDLVVNY